ncbi:hypothetical protein L4D77_27165 [Photobacterium frigidiphilum]|uniref:hypothetical protein n=1 Tax=Photobacterium frigidiphilum TaxID=264736 RepID=UPI003D10998F
MNDRFTAQKGGFFGYDDGSSPKMNDFKSSVFEDEHELLHDYTYFRRDPYKTWVTMNGVMVLVDRQKEQTTLILKQQEAARARLDKHKRDGGTVLALVVPDWLKFDKPLTKYH